MCEVALPTQSLAWLRKALQCCIIQEARESGEEIRLHIGFSHQHQHSLVEQYVGTVCDNLTAPSAEQMEHIVP